MNMYLTCISEVIKHSFLLHDHTVRTRVSHKKQLLKEGSIVGANFWCHNHNTITAGARGAEKHAAPPLTLARLHPALLTSMSLAYQLQIQHQGAAYNFLAERG